MITATMNNFLMTVILISSVVDRSQQQGCTLDVGFMITHSGAVDDQGAGNYENYLLPFARDVTSRLNPSQSGTHVGVVGFADTARTAWNLDTYASNPNDLLNSFTVDNIPNRPGTNTNLAAALSELRLNVMSTSGGDRPLVPNVCILITAGVANINRTGFIPEATQTKASCKLIIVVVGQAASDDRATRELRTGVTNQATDLYIASAFSGLSNIIDSLLDNICQQTVTTIFTTTTTPTTSSTVSTTTTTLVPTTTTTTTTAATTIPIPATVQTLPTTTTTLLTTTTAEPTTTSLISTSTSTTPSTTTSATTDSTTTVTTTIAATIPISATVRITPTTTTTATFSSTTTATQPTTTATFLTTTATTTATTIPIPTTVQTTPTTTTTALSSTPTSTPTTASTIATTTTATTTPSRPTTVSTTPLSPPIGCTNQADVIFVLDSSGSIDSINFVLIKSFVSTMVNSFNVEGGAVRVGLLTFSDNVQPMFNLSQYTTRSSIKSAIDVVPYLSGSTNTAAAIRYVRTVMLTSQAGARRGIQSMVVLVTDGGSNDKQATLDEAMLAKMASIEILVVSIGTWIDQNEVNNLASYPSSATRVQVTNTSSLINNLQTVLDLVCNNADDCSRNPCRNAPCDDYVGFYSCLCPTSTAGRNCERVLVRRVDLVVAVNGATRVGVQNFQLQLDIARELVYGINVNADSQFGALVYADQPDIQFYLNTFSNQRNILAALSIPYPGGGMNVSAAITAIRTQMFTTSAGSRPDIPKIAVIFIDGQSLSEANSVHEAILARQAGITLLVVGISSTGIQLPEWLGIASFPSTLNVFNVPDYSTLPIVVSRLITSIGQDPSIYCLSSPCSSRGTCISLINGYECLCTSGFTGINCERASSGYQDIFILLDTSGSTRSDRFQPILNFLASFVNGLEIRSGKTQVGLITFNETAEVRFDLNAYNTRQDIIYALSRTLFYGGLTNISGGLATALSRMSPLYGDRSDAPDILLLITDGNADVDVQTTVGNAISIRQRGAFVVALAIGSLTNSPVLQALSSDPTNQTILYANSYTALQPGLLNIIYNLMTLNTNVCMSSLCLNGGTCVPSVATYTCQCTIDWTGSQCQRRCGAVSLDVAVVLDLSSADFNQIYSTSLPFIKQVVNGLPTRSDRTRVSLVTAVDTPNVQFYFNTYSNAGDLRQAISIWPTIGRPCLPATISSLSGTVFVTSRGARRGDNGSPPVPGVVIVVTDADFPSNYAAFTNAGIAARQAGLDVYVIGIGDAPDVTVMSAIAGSRIDRVLRVSGPNNVATVADQLLDTLCLS